MNVNKVIIVGNITRDPELKALPSGVQVATFSVATNEVYTDKDGQKQERAEFHNVVAWGKTAENIAKYMRKGSQIYIEGKLQTRSWEKDGQKHYRTEVVAGMVQFGAKPKGDSAPSGEVDEFGDPIEPGQSYAGDGGGSSDGEINPDDIPF